MLVGRGLRIIHSELSKAPLSHAKFNAEFGSYCLDNGVRLFLHVRARGCDAAVWLVDWDLSIVAARKHYAEMPFQPMERRETAATRCNELAQRAHCPHWRAISRAVSLNSLPTHT